MRILITGATGFIGRQISEKLIEKGNEVVVLARKSSIVPKVLKSKAKIVFADIARRKDLQKIKRIKLDVVIHCAALLTNDNWNDLYRANVLGTRNICELCKDIQVKKLVYLSSIEVVSGNNSSFLTGDLPLKSRNLYGKSKLLAEKIIEKYRKIGLKTVIYRPCAVYGPENLRPFYILLKLSNFHLSIPSNLARRKFQMLYVGNLVEALMFAVKNNHKDMFKGAFLIADSEALSFGEMLQLINKFRHKKPLFTIPSLLFLLPIIKNPVNRYFLNLTADNSRLVKSGFKVPYSTKASIIKSLRLNERQQ